MCSQTTDKIIPGYNCEPMPGEPSFRLLARDPQAPGLVTQWAMDRMAAIECGVKPLADLDKVREALNLAQRMIIWRHANDGAWRPQPERAIPVHAEIPGGAVR